MRLWARPLSRAALAARTGLVYAVVEVLLRSWPLPKTVQFLGLAVEPDDLGEIAADRRSRIRRVLRAVDVVGRFWIFEATCLRRTLVAGYLLRSERPVVAIGVRRTPTGEMTMHSWLEVAGHSVDPTSADYDRIKIG